MAYYTYQDLEKRYSKNYRTIWRWWAKERTLEPPKRAGKVFLGWTEDQLTRFESGATQMEVKK